MRVLLIAPGQTGQELDQVPEIRQITSMHRTQVLHGRVSAQDVYQAVSVGEFDVLHVATDVIGDTQRLDQLMLSDGESLDLASMAQVARLGGVRLVFLSMCLGARFGAYLVRHNVPFTIYTTVEIADSTAWRMPLAFYEQCKRMELAGPVDFRAALDKIDANDGIYSWNASNSYYADMISPLQAAINTNRDNISRLFVMVDEIAQKLGIIAPRSALAGPIGRYLFIVAVAVMFVASLISIWEALPW